MGSYSSKQDEEEGLDRNGMPGWFAIAFDPLRPIPILPWIGSDEQGQDGIIKQTMRYQLSKHPIPLL